MAFDSYEHVDKPQSWDQVMAGLKIKVGQYPRPRGPQLPISAPIDEDTFKAIFTLHDEIVGQLRYTELARLLWERMIVPDQALGAEVYEDFRNGIVTGLRRMAIKTCVYPEMIEHLAEFVARHGTTIEELVLWTTGDIEAGIQAAKVMNSRLPTHLGAILAKNKMAFPKGVSSIISAQKLDALGAYMDRLLAENAGKIKLVVIEDSRKNLERINKNVLRGQGMLDAGHERYLMRQSRIQVVPVFALYSAEGQRAREAAVEADNLIEFEQEMTCLNAINSLGDLLEPRFDDILAGSRLLVDFDGVMVRNGHGMDGTRLLRAQAVWPVIVRACMQVHGFTQTAAAAYIQFSARRMLIDVVSK
ncbi:MAG: hypothetical protein HY817_02235 [Candidatus Abawacabacteria bacterium]|nr:hypothetical protein [Candidatus Abawacabacteria bacterium]